MSADIVKDNFLTLTQCVKMVINFNCETCNLYHTPSVHVGCMPTMMYESDLIMRVPPKVQEIDLILTNG